MRERMHFHDPVRHCQYLKQALAQNKLPIGFFIAAGCPLSVKMPEGEWPLIPDVVGLTKFIDETLNKNITDGSYKTLIDELIKTGKKNYNIEDILTFVRSLKEVAIGGTVRGLNEEQLKLIEKCICEEISKKVTVDLPVDETPYQRFANWIQSIDRDVAVEIFTTNYDLLLEQALESSNVPYFDGFVGSNKSFFDIRALEENAIPKHWTRFWKVHGSLNWFKDEFDKVYRGHFNGKDSKSDLHLIYPSHLKYDKSRKMPFLALIDQLQRFISKQTSILILSGYSFNDEHLNNIIVNSLKSNTKSSAFALLFGKLEDYPNAIELASKCSNLSLYALDKAVIGTTEAQWGTAQDILELETSIQELVEIPKDEKDDIKKASFSIGDFNKFSLFLKYLISEDKGDL
jgi:hypothetical protein